MTSTDLVPTLETERLILRGHQAEDFDDCAAMWADPNVVQYISGVPSTQEQTWSRLLRYTGHWQHLGYGYWVVTKKMDGAYMGDVGFADYHRDTDPDLSGIPEAGWVLNTQSHGRGYATEAVAAILHWADAHLPFPKTAAMFDPEHSASIKVARKLGYSGDVLGRYQDHQALFLMRDRPAR